MKKLETVSLRVDEKLLQHTDRVLEKIQKRFPNMTKSEVIRAAWTEGLRHVDKMFR